MKRLTDLLADDRTVVCAWSSVPDSLYLSLLATMDFDAIVLDMQHGMQTEGSVIDAIMAIAPTGKPVIVRIPIGRYDFASKALDAGAHAIIAPMINTAEDARAFVHATKYVPLGGRSFGVAHTTHVLGVRQNDYLDNANDHTLALAMIETTQAVENMDAILDTDGIDGIFCGPSDLSISARGTSRPDAFGPDTLPLIERMGQAAQKRGKQAAIFCMSTDHCETSHAMGFRIISYGFDSTYLAKGANVELAKLSFR